MSSSKAPPGHFTILYFAAASSFTGKEREHIKAPIPLIRLFGDLERLYPGIDEKVLESCAVTVNMDYVDMEEVMEGDPNNPMTVAMIKEGDEVAIIPPVSSG